MSRNLIILLLFILPSASHAQFVSLNELINLSSASDDDFDTYTIKKGYTFYKHEEDEIANSISYSFLINGKRRGYLNKYTYNLKVGGWIELQTTDVNTYLKYKEALKANGFSFYEKGVIKESSWMQYKKGTTSVRIYSSTDYNEITGTTSPHYSIAVDKYAFLN
jgi:hypothetical protein